jgi:2-polyprenyl-3-methyl-5-hydroxy-6-metoxy-1,4-benzoquinol methylase
MGRKMGLHSLRKYAPGWVERAARRVTGDRVESGDAGVRRLPSYRYLHDLMSRYTVDRLIREDAAPFERRIRQFLDLRDAEMEGYSDPSRQRDLSIRFHWGHDHDFGSFSVGGRMGRRHVSLLATFIDELGVLPRDLDGLRVLDVGCWTGGTSLLLCAMGAHVVAIDEVKKYIDCLQYMKEAFDIRNLEPRNLSLYGCVGPEFDDRFDFVLFAGVLYHVTDPVLALRITFNTLVDGGHCLVETATHGSPRPVLLYEGPTRTLGGSAEDLSRGGWNWLVPSPLALRRMMEDVGFREILVRRRPGGRAVGAGYRERHVDMLRAGLSRRSVR